MRQQRSTVLLPPLLTGMSSGARVNSQANWLLIIFKASQHIKFFFLRKHPNDLILNVACSPLVLPVAPLLLPIHPSGLIMKNLRLQYIQYSKRHRGRLENVRTIENVQAWRRRNLQQSNIQNKQTKNNQKINKKSMTTSYIIDVQQLWKWIVSVSIMKRQARY